MTVVNVHEAKTHLSKLLNRVMGGEEITIAKSGKPIAVLSPIKKTNSRRRESGIDAGKIVISDDFDDPLPEFDL